MAQAPCKANSNPTIKYHFQAFSILNFDTTHPQEISFRIISAADGNASPCSDSYVLVWLKYASIIAPNCDYCEQNYVNRYHFRVFLLTQTSTSSPAKHFITYNSIYASKSNYLFFHNFRRFSVKAPPNIARVTCKENTKTTTKYPFRDFPQTNTQHNPAAKNFISHNLFCWW